MMASTSSWATLDDYTFNLTERLREAGRSSLAQFQATLEQDYDWLDGYMDRLEAPGRRAHIAEIMKTPSRTATAKKTRTFTSASKTRTEQLRHFNNHLSPPAASPLQAQSLNALPPSPSRSPLKGKAGPLTAKATNNTKPAPMKKPGRPKKNAMAVDKENAPTPIASPAPSRSLRSVLSPATSQPSKSSKSKKAKVSPKEAKKVVEEPPVEVTPTEVTSKSATKAVEEEPVVREDEHPEEPNEVPQKTEDVFFVEPEVEPMEPVEEPEEHVEEPEEHFEEPEEHAQEPPIEPETAEEILHDSFETIPLETIPDAPTAKDAEKEPEAEEFEDDDDEPVELEQPKSTPAAPRSPLAEIPVAKAPTPAKSPVKSSSPLKPSSPFKVASPTPAPVPTRPVRSSWLSQALGSNTMPISHRTSTQFDALRKSQMASGMGKRKSDEFADDDLDKENKRPDKVARFDSSAKDAASGAPISPKKYFGGGASRQPASAASLPQARVSTPASASLHHTATSVPQARMTKLQEMRERTAAAAAAKQQEKAAAAAAAAAALTAAQTTAASASVTTNGAGFLRGLGNLGVGFLGLSASNSAPADDNRDKDREAQEMAEKELARVLKELEDEDRKKAEEAAAKAAEETIKAAELANKALIDVVDDNEDDGAGDRAILLSDDEEDEDEVNDSIGLPSLPALDDVFDDDSMEADAPGSALGAAGIFFKKSTTPSVSPPMRSKVLPKTKPAAKQAVRTKAPRSGANTPSKIPAPSIVVSPPPKRTGPIRTIGRPMTPARARGATPSSVNEYEPDEEDTPPLKKAKTNSALNSSQTSTLDRAELIAGKVLGVKATPGRVKSVQAAEVAAKREQELKEKRAKQRELVAAKKEMERKQREEEERAKELEERRKRKAEEDERRQRLLQKEKERKERMEKVQRQKEEREAAEAAEARAKQAEDEANRKRKMAPTLARSTSTNNLTKSTASSINKSVAANKPHAAPGQIKRVAPKTSTLGKGKEPLGAKTGPKAGPNAFRTHEPEASSSTIKPVAAAASARPALGPPSRTSAVPSASRASAVAGPSSQVTQVTQVQQTQVHAATLQHQRTTLQAQLDAKAVMMESEAIILPDIASEYSDSDDSDKETDFQRPAWAESPQLKHALEMQANINPDELFGPIRPLQMDELFQGRAGKFRARTSSANWSGTDRLTETEERDYARRMGFQPLKAPRDGGGTAADR